MSADATASGTRLGLVGRVPERAILAGALAAALDGRRQVVLVAVNLALVRRG